MIYLICAMPLIIAFCVLAVDVGRLQLARSEAQGVADSAARYAARGMVNSYQPAITAFAHASAVCAESKVDGASPTVAQSEVELGTWNASTRVFSANSSGNAVRVTVRQTLGRSGSAPLFASILSSNKTTQVVGVAVAQCTSIEYEIQPPASGNLWLSGAADNTTYNNMRPDNSTVWDNSGSSSGNKKQRPLEVSLSDAGLKAGDTIALEGLTGSASWQNTNSNATNSADGDASYLVANGVAPASSLPSTNANGLSNTRAPIGAVMAVFMNDNAPSSGSTPANLDFGTAAQRDYVSISPQLKQVFFIGDGKRSDGTAQSIIVPQGATRVFFGMMDAWQWNDNTGNFKMNLYSTTSTSLVK